MPRIADLLGQGPTLSFEFFPPRTDEAERTLDATVTALAPLAPSFVSVTYGAGGSTRGRTRDLVVRINGEQPYPAMPHLTCVGHRRSELASLLEDYRASGIRNVLALAGDPPADGTPAEGDFAYALELVELIREVDPECSIGVAAHPELHPRSTDRRMDRRYLAEKLAAADFGVTQFFFNADDYFRMVEELAALGCEVPVLPGVIPVLNPTSVARFAEMAGAHRPPELWDRLTAAQSRPEELYKLAVEQASVLAAELLERGVPGLHLYCMNRADAVSEIVRNVGLR